MTLLTARRLVDTVIIFMILSFVGSWVKGLSPSVVSILVSLTYLLSYRMARQKITVSFSYYAWMWSPTILFVVIPVFWDIRTSNDFNFISAMASALPLFSLIIPVGLLLIVRSILIRHYLD
ncbi:MAG: hypothetical protein ACE5GZ_04615 [Gammaproteobacteria bacterium]